MVESDIIFAIVIIVFFGVVIAWLELSLIKINRKLDKLTSSFNQRDKDD